MTTSPHFIYIEDDEMSRSVMDILLKKVLGFSNVTIFESSADCVQKISALSAPPDVLFVDIQIQPYDGFEVLRQVRAEPRYAGLKVIAMTANVMSHDVDSLKRAGFSGLIGKPIMQDVFPQLVKTILAGDAVWFVP